MPERVDQIRLVVAPRPPNTVAAVRASIATVLGQGWQVRRLLPGSDLILVIGRAASPVGTEAHARQSHEAAVALHGSGRFAKVEADIPVRGYSDQESVTSPDGVGAFGAPPLDWVHEILSWEQALQSTPASVRGGVGIVIGHPDTGYTDHPNMKLDALDLTRDRDVISNDDDARDDLQQHPLWPLPFPGHGTSTGSVIVGRGSTSTGIVGLATKATLVPIRATESVVQLFDSDVAKAVAHARRVGCHVVSMSLGGKGFFGLKDEIQRAVNAGMIVMAAAGNYVGFVTAPASYDNCLAVAATGPDDTRWSGSSRGDAVDVAMPGEQVYNARYSDAREPFVGPGNGTSFAVAHLAAAAALWLARHGRASLTARYGARNVQAAFLATLRWPGVCVVPPAWDFDWGMGRVDLRALLAAPLPARGDLGGVSAFGDAVNDAASRIAAAISADPVLVRIRLAELLRATDPDELSERLDRHEGELVYLAYTDPSFAAAVTQPGGVGAFGPQVNTAGVSGELQTLLAG